MRMFPARPVAQIIRFGVGNREVLFAAADAVVAEAGGQNPGRLGSGFGDTVDFDHIKRHYYQMHADINPPGPCPPAPTCPGGSPHTAATHSAVALWGRHPARTPTTSGGGPVGNTAV